MPQRSDDLYHSFYKPIEQTELKSSIEENHKKLIQILSKEEKVLVLIKREWINRFKIRDHTHANRLVFEYIEAFYNTKRIHSHCDYMSPDDFERLYADADSGYMTIAG